MGLGRFFKLNAAMFLLFVGVNVFAQEVVLTEAEKFYGIELRAPKKVQHPPFEWGDCTVCHTDAKGEGALIMDAPELCAMCHEAKDDKEFIHGPVAAGACTACHDPHQSDNAKLLTASSINELCNSCHQDKDEFMRNTANIHPPVKDQCTNCHDPHTENHLYQLKADGKQDLCVMCHVDKEVWINNVSDKHGALDKPRKCLECHDPHGSSNPKFLIKDTSKELCLTCHSDSLVRDEDGSHILNIGKHLDNNPDWHGPILWGDCAACHNPHGSNNLSMLNKPFPRTFYENFEEENYICFQCHEKEKIMDANTTTETNFRNGSDNMHFVHVNKEKGRSCRACHDFHGTKEYPHHLRKNTQFGKINFPIRFIEAEDGGSCAPACHARRHYDRVTPKVNLK